MITLTAWLREQLDADESSLQAGLVEHLGSRPENDYRFRLVELDAKRRIVNRAEQWLKTEGWATGDSQSLRLLRDHYLATVRDLALPYAEREGYLEEWRP